jgi:hypothetical protein
MQPPARPAISLALPLLLIRVKGDELVHQLRPRHHRPTRRHAALKSMPPHGLDWVAFDSRKAPTTGAAFDTCTASTTGSASAISSSSVLIAFRIRAIDRSLFSEKCWRGS